MIVELKPYYDTCKSFYGKAYIEFNERNNVNKTYTLYSYGTPIMKITKYYIHFTKPNGTNELYSNTTVRHIREFMRQYAHDSELNITKKEIIKYNYCLVNTGRTYGDTRQKAIKEFNN